jgi:hypothetical protein
MSDETKEPVKPGYATTEFWLSLAAAVSGALVSSGLFATDSTVIKVAGLITTILASLGYTYARTVAKGPQ